MILEEETPTVQDEDPWLDMESAPDDIEPDVADPSGEVPEAEREVDIDGRSVEGESAGKEDVPPEVAELRHQNAGLLGALKAERSNRQNAQREKDALEQRIKALEEKFGEDAAEPDDPLERIDKKIAGVESKLNEREIKEKLVDLSTAINGPGGERFREFEQKRPDYPQALQAGRQALKELLMQSMPAEQADVMVNLAELNLGKQAIDAGLDPHEHIYATIQKEIGWGQRPPEEAPAAPESPQPPPRPRRAPSLSRAGGEPPPPRLTVDDLDESDERMVDPNKWKRMMGG